MVENLRIVFMGTPEFAACSLEKLIMEKFNVIGCFTNQDKPSGRGMKLKCSQVKDVAIKNNIEVYQPKKLRNNDEVLEILKKWDPNLIVVVAYGKILPKEVLEYPKYGCINVHGSLLPKYRGSAPIQWSIINGEEKTGITTMFMDEGMDTGNMLLKSEVDINDNDNFETLHDKLKDVGASLLIKTLNKLQDGTLEQLKQDDILATYAPMITRDITKIDFNKKGREIFNFVRGMCPFPGSYFTIDGKKYKVFECSYYNEDVNVVMNKKIKENGEVSYVSKDSLYIKCQDGYISIKNIQAENGKKMDITSFLAGNKIEVGSIAK